MQETQEMWVCSLDCDPQNPADLGKLGSLVTLGQGDLRKVTLGKF